MCPAQWSVHRISCLCWEPQKNHWDSTCAGSGDVGGTPHMSRISALGNLVWEQLNETVALTVIIVIIILVSLEHE